jgi:hypothetical protein
MRRTGAVSAAPSPTGAPDGASRAGGSTKALPGSQAKPMLQKTPIASLLVSIVHALDQRNWHAALNLALAMPVLCANLDGRYRGDPQGNYREWFNRFVAGHLADENAPAESAAAGTRGQPFDGDACYALRCRVLHERSVVEAGGQVALARPDGRKIAYEITVSYPASSGANAPFEMLETYAAERRGSLRLHIDVYMLCLCIAKGVMSWLDEVENDEEISAMIGNMLTIEDPETAVRRLRRKVERS